MKVIAFNGSPRSDGNIATLIDLVFDELGNRGIDTELYQIGGKKIRPCDTCMKCFQRKDKRCVIEHDILNECLEKMMEADAIILGSPTYFANVSTEMKALIDRAGLVSIANDHLLKYKIGTAIVAVRRAGAVHAFNSINQFFFINQMIVQGYLYWNMLFGLDSDENKHQDEGKLTMKILGENLSWLIKRVH